MLKPLIRETTICESLRLRYCCFQAQRHELTDKTVVNIKANQFSIAALPLHFIDE